MQTQHLEVIPRIIDASIAVNYQKTEPLTTKVAPTKEKEAVKDTATTEDAKTALGGAIVATTFTQRFFATLKDYMIPIIFIIVVIICIYIVWKYFTAYRKTSDEVIVVAPVINTLEPDNPDKPDLSKYLLDLESSDDEEEETDSKLSAIEEESEEDDEEEDDDEDEEEDDDEDEDAEETEEEGSNDEDDNNSIPSLHTEPDLDAITSLINQSIDNQRMNNIFLLDEEPARFEYVSPTPDVSDEVKGRRIH